MITTVFFTRCCKNHRDEPGGLRWWRAFAFLWLLALGLAFQNAVAGPPAAPPDGGELRLERGDDGLYLAAQLQFVLPSLVEDALYKGIPMHFIAEAQVLRDRWYWSDRVVAEATRYLRLSYQPLTRRWRLNVSPVPFSNNGLGVALAQTFDDYGDAMAAVQRISRWKIAEGDMIEADAVHTVNFRFRLDISQLPRPFQIGAVGRSGWSLLVARSQRLAAEPAK